MVKCAFEVRWLTGAVRDFYFLEEVARGLVAIYSSCNVIVGIY